VEKNVRMEARALFSTIASFVWIQMSVSSEKSNYDEKKKPLATLGRINKRLNK